MAKTLLNVQQVWERLNRSISKSKLYALAASGRIRSTRSLDRLLIEWESVEELLGQESPPDRADDRGGEGKGERVNGVLDGVRPDFPLW